MAWTSPLTAVANASLTAAQWNASVRDNLLETPAAKATTAGSIFVATGANAIAERVPSAAVIGTSDSSAVTSYNDLTVVGPVVTVTTGTKAIVIVGAALTTDTAGTRAYMGYAVGGVTSIGAADATALGADTSAANRIMQASRVIMQTSLNTGSNTFTAKYRVTSTNGAWAQRNIIVIPL